MDRIEFIKVGSGAGDEVRVLINSEDLIAMLANYEAPFAAAEKTPRLAGSYVGLSPFVALPPSEHFFGDTGSCYYDRDLTEILTCECRTGGCWSLYCRIDATDDRVTWSAFEQPQREGEWSYDSFGPFTFDRARYEMALDQAASMKSQPKPVAEPAPRQRSWLPNFWELLGR